MLPRVNSSIEARSWPRDRIFESCNTSFFSYASSATVAIDHTIAGLRLLLKLSHVLQFKNDFVFLKTIAYNKRLMNPSYPSVELLAERRCWVPGEILLEPNSSF